MILAASGAGKHRHGRQHAVDAALQFQAVGGRLKMDVAGPGLAGGGQHRIDAARRTRDRPD